MNGFYFNDFNSFSVRPELVEGLRVGFSAESSSEFYLEGLYRMKIYNFAPSRLGGG
jgi:hypothetical protein